MSGRAVAAMKVILAEAARKEREITRARAFVAKELGFTAEELTEVAASMGVSEAEVLRRSLLEEPAVA